MTLVLTQLMNFAFIGWLRHAGLALSIGLASCFNAAFLYRGLRSRGVYSPAPGWPVFLLKLAAALTVMGLGLIWGANGDATWLEGAAVPKLARLSALVAGGGTLYLGTLWLLGFRLREFKRRAA
jgi:putative peptidoglycan lipid II flippase